MADAKLSPGPLDLDVGQLRRGSEDRGEADRQNHG